MTFYFDSIASDNGSDTLLNSCINVSDRIYHIGIIVMVKSTITVDCNLEDIAKQIEFVADGNIECFLLNSKTPLYFSAEYSHRNYNTN